MNKWNRKKTIPGKSQEIIEVNNSDNIIVIPLHGKGKELKHDSVYFVEKNNIYGCIEKIFKDNPDTTFYSVYYEEASKELHFLSDTQELKKSEWFKSKDNSIKKMESKKKIKEEIARLLVDEKTDNQDMISIFDVYQLISEYSKKYDELKKKYNELLTSQIADKNNKMSANKELEMGIRDIDIKDGIYQIITAYNYYSTGKKNLTIAEENIDGDADYYISKGSEYDYNYMLHKIAPILPQMFADFRPLLSYKKQSVSDINTNSPLFKVSIYHFSVNLYVGSANHVYNEFEISKNTQYGYFYECNSVNLMNFLEERTDELFNSVFVNINDCPEWMRERLHQIRNEQLQQATGIHKEFIKAQETM